jgi:sugar lactone lactonase YvrE
MKMIKRLFPIVLACCFFAGGQAQSPAFRIAYTIPENDLIPEGLAYDPVKKDFYISSTYKRKIVRIDARGRVSDFTGEQQDGLLGVIGMRVDAVRRVLWAASGDLGPYMPVKNSDSTAHGHSALFKYDLNSGKLLQKFELNRPGQAYFLNDLTIDRRGKVYITEMIGQKIYTVDPAAGRLEIFMELPKDHYPNGIDISPDNRFLFVAMYADPKPVYGRIDLKTRKLDLLELPPGVEAGADGLYFYKNTLIAVLPGNNNPRIIQYFLNPSLLKVKRIKVYVDYDPLLSQPTTGAIVGKRFFFIATSNLQLFAAMFKESGGQVDPARLPPVRIGVFKLK